MVSKLRLIGHVHTFMIVLSSKERFSDRFQETIELFVKMFGSHFFKNAMLMFTRFGRDEKSIRERERDKVTEEILIAGSTKVFSEKF